MKARYRVVALALLVVAWFFTLAGCAGKSGETHPNKDDWSAFKDAFL